MGFLLVILKVQCCAHCSLSTELMCFWPVRDGNGNNINNNRKNKDKTIFVLPCSTSPRCEPQCTDQDICDGTKRTDVSPQVSDDASVEVQGGANKAAGFLKNHKLWNSKIYFRNWVDQFASKRMSIYF